MKFLVAFLSVIAAVPINEQSIDEKSCRTTCSGKADNFRQFYPYTLELQGEKNALRLNALANPDAGSEAFSEATKIYFS